MQATFYSGKPEGAYIDGNFFALMQNLWSESNIFNKTYPMHPNPNDLKCVGGVVNIWHVWGVTIVYHGTCEWTDDTYSKTESTSVSIVMKGHRHHIEDIETKIAESIREGLDV